MADLWSLVWGKPEVDPAALAQAIDQTASQDRLDFRTRLLIRDGTDALEDHWGKERFLTWLKATAHPDKIEIIRHEDLGEVGFPFLKDQLMERTEPETVKQYLRELGTQIHHPVRLRVGGSIALILPGYLSRATQDIDVVDEVPAEIRQERELLDQLAERYRLQLTHFQSHFLPSGWENRLHSLGAFGNLQVFTVDPYDVFLSKLFSKRAKDLDDLRALSSVLNRETILERLQATTAALMAEPLLRQNAEKNWYILYGEPLPGPPAGSP
jgi:hypothetical protein